MGNPGSDPAVCPKELTKYGRTFVVNLSLPPYTVTVLPFVRMRTQTRYTEG